MSNLLNDVPCYKKPLIAEVEIRMADKTIERLDIPSLPILEGGIMLPQCPGFSTSVQALLDTGCDITIVSPETVTRLEEVIASDVPVKKFIPERGTVLYTNGNRQQREPLYLLAFVFPGGKSISSLYGFVAPTNWSFDVADVWLGQDILSQLVVTFNGIKGTVTIDDPRDT